MSKFKPAVAYLPHSSPMVMIEQVYVVDEDSVECGVDVSLSGVLAPFLTADGALPAWFGIELMAQTIGVWSGWHGGQRDEIPRLGMLLGGRAFHSDWREYPLDSALRISAKMVLRDEKIASFECVIHCQGQKISQGRLNTYQPDRQEIQKIISGENA